MKRTFLVIVVLCRLGAAQTQPPVADRNQSKAPLPAYEITLAEDSDYPSLPWRAEDSLVVATCTGDGNVYVAKEGLGLVGLTRNGIVPFLANKMADINKPFMSFVGNGPVVTDSRVYLRVTGIDDSKFEIRTVTDDQGQKKEEKWLISESFIPYLAQFGKDGAYKGASRLDIPFEVYTFNAFDSGNFIVQGLDKTKRPHVALLNSDTRLLRYLDLPKDISIAPGVSHENPECRGCAKDVDLTSVVFSSHFTAWNGRMLFLRHLTRSARVYEIQDGGAVRVVNVTPPEGYKVGGLVPTNGLWLITMFEADRKPTSEFRYPLLFEVNPENGQLLREYRVTAPETLISCSFDGVFWSVRRDIKEEKLKVVRGTAQPYP